MLSKLLFTLRSAFVCTLSLIASATVAQTTIHVGAGQAYTTIQAGIDAASNGDTVLVGPGTYNENINFYNATIAVISAEGAAKTIIQGNVATAPVVTMDSPGDRRNVLNGFTIRPVRDPSPSVSFPDLAITNSSPTILNNVITNNPCYDITVNNGGPLIQGNVISDTDASNDGGCGSFTGSAIILFGAQFVESALPPVLVGNKIVHNQHAGIFGGGGILNWSAPSVVIEGNVFAENASTTGAGGAIVDQSYFSTVIAQNLFYANAAKYGGGAVVVGVGGTLLPFTGLIQSNTFVGNTTLSSTDQLGLPAASQVSFNSNFGSLEFTDNIVVGADSNAAVACQTSSSGPPPGTLVFDHNDVYNRAGTTYGGTCPGQDGEYGNISADPLFKDAANNDYHLLAGSPAIDTGNNSALQLIANQGYPLSGDFDGNPRVLDATDKSYPVIDMGAYEYAGKDEASPTTMVLSPSLYSLVGSQFLTLTADMYSPLGTPTGTVTFFEDGSQVGVATINGKGVASLTLSKAVTIGNHAFLGTYSGEGKFTPCESVKIYVVGDGFGVDLTLTSAPNPSQVGQGVTFQIKISSDSGVPPGSIALTDSTTGTTLATLSPNASGSASYSTSALAVGTHVIEASYAGNANYLNASSSVSQVVEAAAVTTTTLSSSLDPAPFGTSVTFKARLYFNGTSQPAGAGNIIHLSVNGQTVVLATDASGSASYTIGTLVPGSYPVTASFAGTNDLQTSSASLTEVITAVSTSTSLSGAPNPGVRNQSVMLAARVVASITSANVQGGSVTFYDGADSLGSQKLSADGTASLNASFSTVGVHNLTAEYEGDADFTKSVSEVFKETITAGDFSIEVKPGAASVYTGVAAAVQVSVASLQGFHQPLALSCSGLPANATCSFSPASLFDGQGGAKLTIQTAAPHKAGSKSASAAVALGAFALLLVPGWKRRRSLLAGLSGVLLAVGLGVGMTGCASVSPITGGTPPGTYQVAVTAATTGAGTGLAHSAVVTLTVKSLF